MATKSVLRCIIVLQTCQGAGNGQTSGLAGILLDQRLTKYLERWHHANNGNCKIYKGSVSEGIVLCQVGKCCDESSMYSPT
jgi:hypothetical protein